MSYVLIGAAGLILLYFGLRWFASANPKQVTRAMLVASVLLGIGAVVLLAVGGRLGWLIGAASLLVPFLVRWRNARRLAGMASGDGTSGMSHVDTAYLRMTLDHETGALDGEIRRGSLRGRFLSSLDLTMLRGLLAEVTDDPASVQVLTAYLDREHGTSWRANDSTANPSAGDMPAMTRDEAYRILGLEPGADEAAIREAHRRLMLKFHPDQGGSAWFAARLNEARDLLIGH